MEMSIVWIILGEFAFISWIIWVVANFKIKKSRERSDERLRLMEQLGTSKQLTEFMDSEGGERLLRAFGPKPANPRGMVLAGFTTGLVILFAGIGFLILAWLQVFGDPDVFLIPGVLSCLAGTAVLLSVAVGVRLLKTEDVPEQ